MTARTMIWVLIVMWAIFGALTFGLRTDYVFHCIDAIALAAGLTTMFAYAPGIRDAWRSRNTGIHDGQLLALGVFANWLGMTVRLSRWYITDAEPVPGGLAAWAYNVGLWISVCAAGLLVAALATSPPVWSPQRILAHCGAFLALVVLLMQVDFNLFP